MGKGGQEMLKSFSPKMVVRDLQKFIPSLTFEDIVPGQGAAGVRAQALDEDGIFFRRLYNFLN